MMKDDIQCRLSELQKKFNCALRITSVCEATMFISMHIHKKLLETSFEALPQNSCNH